MLIRETLLFISNQTQCVYFYKIANINKILLYSYTLFAIENTQQNLKELPCITGAFQT